MIAAADKRMGLIALSVLFWDQVSKYFVRSAFSGGEEKVILDGFFKLVHWRNTGAAWSAFHGHNAVLAGISICALVLLVCFRRHFDAGSLPGQIALGLILGGILGNLSDRVFIGYVVDFLRFYLYQRGGNEIGFPAFNVADSAICVGVGLLLLRSILDQPAASPASGARP